MVGPYSQCRCICLSFLSSLLPLWTCCEQETCLKKLLVWYHSVNKQVQFSHLAFPSTDQKFHCCNHLPFLYMWPFTRLFADEAKVYQEKNCTESDISPPLAGEAMPKKLSTSYSCRYLLTTGMWQLSIIAAWWVWAGWFASVTLTC
jgi:hypothetical protein